MTLWAGSKTNPSARLRVDWGDTINSGLVSAWPFNEIAGAKANDIGPNHHTAVWTGTPVFSSGRYGQTVASENFSTSFLSTPNASDLDPVNALSVAAWVQPINLTGSSFPGIDKDRSAAWSVVWDYADVGSIGHQLRLIVFVGGLRRDIAATTTVLADGVWTHMCATYDGSNGNVVLYEQGVSLSPPLSTVSGTIGSSTQDLLFSGLSGFGGLIGNLSDVRIWNRVISASEVARLIREPFAGFKTDAKNLFFAQAVSGAASLGPFYLSRLDGIGGGGYFRGNRIQ